MIIFYLIVTLTTLDGGHAEDVAATYFTGRDCLEVQQMMTQAGFEAECRPVVLDELSSQQISHF